MLISTVWLGADIQGLEFLLGYLYGKTAPPEGTTHLGLRRTEGGVQVVALDSDGAELAIWDLPASLAGRPAISRVSP